MTDGKNNGRAASSSSSSLFGVLAFSLLMVEEQAEDKIDEGQWVLVAFLILDSYTGISDLYDLYMFAKENTGHQGLLAVNSVKHLEDSVASASLTACQAVLTCFPPAVPKVSLSPSSRQENQQDYCCCDSSLLSDPPPLCHSIDASYRPSLRNRHEFGRSRLAPKGGQPASHPRRIEANLPNLLRTFSIDPSV